MAKSLLDSLFADLHKTAQKRKGRDKDGDKAAAIRAILMPCQARLERDRAKRVAVRSARQVGKSTAALLISVIRCLERAQSDWVIIGLTRASVKKAYWRDLQSLSDAFELKVSFQYQELVATFPNGSRIYFVGAENLAEIEKLRGGRYHGCIVDECKSFAPATFSELVTDVLEPALMGQAGCLYLIGTPGDVLQGDFYLATCEPPVRLETEQGVRWSNRPFLSPKDDTVAIWSLHVWSLQDNITVKTDPVSGQKYTFWEQALRIKADRGWTDDHPTWQREYLGKWVAAFARLVYRYRPHVHDYRPDYDNGGRFGLPGPRDTEWRTVVGWDLGSKDGTAAVVWAYSPHEPGLWEIWSERRVSSPESPLNVATLARWYKTLAEEFGPFDGDAVDNAGLATMVVETLAVEHEIYLEPAEKREKNDFIELFNNDLDAGLIHVKRGSQLSEELQHNKWLEKTIGTDRRKEDPKTPNDTCDAGLYAFRWARHRMAKPRGPGLPPIGSVQWLHLAAEQELEAVKAKHRDAGPKLDQDWWE